MMHRGFGRSHFMIGALVGGLLLSLAHVAAAQDRESRSVSGGDPLLGAVIATADAMAGSSSPSADPQEQSGSSAGSPQGDEGQQGGAQGGQEVQDNGTNPASLGFKFMPYYRYTELQNGVKSTENLVLFAMIGIPLTPFTAAVLEWPVQMSLDLAAVVEDNLPPSIPCAPPTCGGDRPLPQEAIVRGFDVQGVGDFRLRILQGVHMKKGKKPGAATVLLVGADIMTPAASDPILGDETWYGSPIFAHVHNLNAESFFAFLHFYFFDWSTQSNAHPINQDKDIGFYMGRYFFQKAWSKSGYYMLPEVQVIYDTKTDAEWSLMFLPEFGKSFQAGSTGMTAYIKPGWGLNPDAAERSFSVELGMRIIP